MGKLEHEITEFYRASQAIPLAPLPLQQMSEPIAPYILDQLGHSPTPGQLKAIESISFFLQQTNQENLFLLTGYAGTGKTTLLAALVKALRHVRLHCELMAPTGRAAKVLSSYCGKGAQTIHRKIYRYSTASEGFGSFSLQPNPHSNTLFIVDEASLISWEESPGFNRQNLLEDLMLYVAEGENCRLMLCGDTAQLPPVGMNFSPALDKAFLIEKFFTDVWACNLSEVVRQDQESGILYNATNLRKHLLQPIESWTFDLNGYKDMISIYGPELEEYLQDAYQKNGEDEVAIICRSNKRAWQYNREIRSRIFFREEALVPGDRLMVIKNNYFWETGSSQEDFIANGDIITVTRISKSLHIEAGLPFARISGKLEDHPEQPEISVNILLSLLDTDQAAMNPDDWKQFELLLIQEMEVSNMRAARKELRKHPYAQALHVKYAYAITCHKAQGGQWDSVFVDQGYLSEEMIDTEWYRWLYTALTRARKKVYLLNFNKRFLPEGN